MQLKLRQNPLLKPAAGNAVFDCEKLTGAHCFKSKVPDKVEIKKLMRKQTAAEAIGRLYPDCAIFGITKGQFSLIELLAVILEQTGPADVFLSTWTAAHADLNEAHEFLKSGVIRSFYCLVDKTFQRRGPSLAHRIRELFGYDAIRVTRNHAKFCMVRNDQWDLVVNTSMNLNFNPRLENFYIQDHRELAEFLQEIMDQIFKKMPASSVDDVKHKSERFHQL